MNPLDEIEKRIRSILEASTTLFPWSDQNSLLVHKLCEALQRYFTERSLQREMAAPVFKIYMNPSIVDNWKKQPGWEKTLSEAMKTSSAEFGVRFTSTPRFNIIPKNSLAQDEVKVELEEATILTDRTGAIPFIQASRENHPSAESESDPCLIDQEENCIPLKKSVINIGRRSNNTIVVNDLRVSRAHAQIRKIQREYVLFDVGSTGGTYVNGERIDTHSLRAGDVISLAGYSFIFHIERSEKAEMNPDQTTELKASSGQEKI